MNITTRLAKIQATRELARLDARNGRKPRAARHKMPVWLRVEYRKEYESAAIDYAAANDWRDGCRHIRRDALAVA